MQKYKKGKRAGPVFRIDINRSIKVSVVEVTQATCSVLLAFVIFKICVSVLFIYFCGFIIKTPLDAVTAPHECNERCDHALKRHRRVVKARSGMHAVTASYKCHMSVVSEMTHSETDI